ERLIRKHLPVAEDPTYRSGYGAATPTDLDPRHAHGAGALSQVHPGMPGHQGKRDASDTRPDGRPGRSRRESKWTSGFGASKPAPRHASLRRAEW
ncbi:MAG: hypothetical protein H6Q82_2239, partial [Deltaproteobacteria bacterium]|nr:hypothetical protein [Deltaproteobacteria bacterium]